VEIVDIVRVACPFEEVICSACVGADEPLNRS